MSDLYGGTAQVRFVAVAQGTPAADFYVNGTGSAYGLGYESFTSYLPVGTGTALVAAHRNGTAQAFTNAQENLSSGHQYTVLLGSGGGEVHERIYADREQPAAPGELALRVLNATEPGSVTTFLITPTGTNLATPPVQRVSLGAGEAGGYFQLPAGTYSVEATVPSGSLHVPVANITVKGRSGSVRTVVFAGAPVGEHRSGVVAFTLPDADLP